jgi:hypothetical protein
MESNSSSGSNTFLWIVILILVTFLLNDDGGGESGAVTEGIERVRHPLKHEKNVLETLCTPVIRSAVDEMRDLEVGTPERNNLEDLVQGQLQGDPTFVDVLAREFRGETPIGINVQTYDNMTFTARKSMQRFNGISDILEAQIGDCGTTP